MYVFVSERVLSRGRDDDDDDDDDDISDCDFGQRISNFRMNW